MEFHQAIGGGVSEVVAVMVWAAAGKAKAQAARPAVKANNFMFVDPLTEAEALSARRAVSGVGDRAGRYQLSRSPR